mmetsp:Transcript_62225/g.144777  ORF Transcript_62225/g.144777 Transcript_62225/m.144777 type:complete len:625 (+) Transcript_62225:63-1937(+)
MDAQVEEQLSEPVRRAWRRLQNNLEQATERHYQEQRMLVTGFLNDMLRMEKRQLRGCARDRSLSERPPRETSQSEAPVADHAVLPRAATRDESFLRTSLPLDRLRCSQKQVMQSKLVVAAAGGRELSESEVQVEKEWLSKLTRHFVHQVGSFSANRSTDWLKAKALASTDSELLLNPFALFFHWFMSLEEPQRDGQFAGIVQSRFFEFFCCTLICVNSFATWTLVNEALDEAASGVVEVGSALALVNFLFVLWYWVELVLKLSVHRFYFFCNDDWGWNLFDTALVLMSTVEALMTVASKFTLSSRVTVARIARFCRVVRIFRVVKAVPMAVTPRLMLDCLVQSTWPFVWAILLLCFTLYIFAILIVQSLTSFLVGESAGAPPETDVLPELLERFGSIELTMMSLFQAATFGESWVVQYRLMKHLGWAAAATYVLFVAVFSVVVWNLFTGVMVQRIFDLAAPDLTEDLNEKQKKQLDMEEMLLSAFLKMDKDLSGSISLDEFAKAMTDDEFRDLFKKTGLDIDDIAFLFEVLTTHTGEETLDIRDVVLGAMKLKGVPSSLDSFTVLQMVRKLGEEQRDFILFCMRRLQGITEHLQVADDLSPRGSDAVNSVHRDIASLSRIDILL